jgi:hypothetical protein
MEERVRWLFEKMQSSLGPTLHPYGPHHSDAAIELYVCMDSFFGSPGVWMYDTADARIAVENFMGIRRYGTGNGNLLPNTGYGVLVPPEKGLNATWYPLPSVSGPGTQSQNAVMVVRALLARLKYTVQGPVTKAQDIKGTDLVVTKDDTETRVQVKSRGPKKRFPCLFIQTHEANPEKIHI